MISPVLLNELYLIGKAAGGAATAATVFYGCLRWLFPKIPIFKKVNDIDSQVNLLATNHLPHIQAAIDSQASEVSTIKLNVEKTNMKVDLISVQMSDTKVAVHSLNDSFLRHLENTSKESKEPVTVTATTTMTTAGTTVKKKKR